MFSFVRHVREPFPAISSVVRRVVYHTPGVRRGALRRLIALPNLARRISPYVLLTAFDGPVQAFVPDLGWQPYSGIASLTLLIEGEAAYNETTGPAGVMHAGHVEWMRAGRGAWQCHRPMGPGRLCGFQLHIALPPKLENAPALSRHLQLEEIPADGAARVLLGRSGNVASPLAAVAPPGINVLDVHLEAGQVWTYKPPSGHLIGWIAVHQGTVRTPDAVREHELAVFEPVDEPIHIIALTESRFLLGSSKPHPYRLVHDEHSVHTSKSALVEGEFEIERLGRESQAHGVLPEASASGSCEA